MESFQRDAFAKSLKQKKEKKEKEMKFPKSNAGANWLGVLILIVLNSLLYFSQSLSLSSMEPLRSIEDPHTKNPHTFFYRDTFATALNLPEMGNPDLNEEERVQLQGSIIFQRFIYQRQFSMCNEDLHGETSPSITILSLPKEHRFGFFSQLQGIVHSLLESLSDPNHVLSWKHFQSLYINQERCPNRSFDCLFLPITSCDNKPSLYRRENMRNSCVFEYPRRRMNEQPFPLNSSSQWTDKLGVLREISGISQLNRSDLFSPHFFIREALRFIARPNPDLRSLIRDLLQHDFKPLPNWRPFTFSNVRVSVHIRAGEDKKIHTGVLDAKYYSRLIDRFVQTNSSQVLFSSDSREEHTTFANHLAQQPDFEQCSNEQQQPLFRQGLFIAHSRFGQLVSLAYESQANLTQDIGMLLMAQALVFSSTDLFVGFIPSNMGQTVHLLMGALRHTSLVPVLDVGGSPMSSCNHFTEYPLRIIRHISLPVSM